MNYPAFLITNNKKVNNHHFSIEKKFNYYTFFSTTQNIYSDFFKGKNINICIVGQILPRINFDIQHSFNQYELLLELLERHESNFIRYIKGHFIIVIFNDTEFEIFTSRSGINKVFIYNNDNEFYITNYLCYIKDTIKLKPDWKGIIDYCVFNNNINSHTLFSNVFYSEPASHIQFKNRLLINKWFDSLELLNIEKKSFKFEDISQDFIEIFENIISNTSHSKLYLTLTGGLDSRLILTLLLKFGCDIECMVYGNEQSSDVQQAMNIAKKLNIDCLNSPISESILNYENLVDEIVATGSGLISMHRAHRFFAYKTLSENNVLKDGLLFTGHMGGELIRNFFYDGIIVTPLMSFWMSNFNKSKRNRILLNAIFSSFIKDSYFSSIQSDYLSYLNSIPFFKCNKSMNEFLLTFNHLIGVHHAQDILLANNSVPNVCPYYLDDELIELFFKTGYNFYNNSLKQSKSILNTKSIRFYCELMNSIYPQLGSIPFIKKGQYTVNEYLNDNRIKFLLKRIMRYTKHKNHGTPNFSYDSWFIELIMNNLDSIKSNPILNEIFDLRTFENVLLSNQHGNSENYWRNFSNIVFLNKVLRYYTTL